jgi:hypothetical protein
MSEYRKGTMVGRFIIKSLCISTIDSILACAGKMWADATIFVGNLSILFLPNDQLLLSAADSSARHPYH